MTVEVRRNEVALLRQVIETQRLINAAMLDADEVMRVVAESAQTITGGTGGVVELAEGDEMVYRAATGGAAGFVGTRLKLKGSLSGLCVRTGNVLRCGDSETDVRVDREACRRIGVRSMVVVPLLHAEGPVGVLKVVSSEPECFDSRDIETLELLAGFIAASLTNASAYRDESRRALHDPLTGLPNRTLLADRLEQALRHARRNKHHVAVVYLDLDGFKPVNDEHGHSAGDQLLRAVARELSRALRASDTVARVGGDEFVVICDRTDPAWGDVITGRVHAAVASARRSMPFTAAVTASIGVAWSDGQDSPEALLSAADASMYEAKRGTRTGARRLI
jgi:diguanylate cyclase (GGDEF)-like protein